MRPRGVLIAAIMMAALPSQARGTWVYVVPRPDQIGAYLDLFGAYERNENSYRGRSAVWYDSFLRQKITFFSTGYFYHPRFLVYDVSLAGALKQEEYRANFLEDTGWTSSSGVEYDNTLRFLPEHPYNLELFARRFEPLFKEQSAAQRDNVETSRGVSLRYRKKPYFFDTRFSKDAVESDVSRSNVTRWNTSGEYWKRFASGRQFSVSAAHNSSDFTNSAGLQGDTAENQVSGLVDFQRIRLSSSVLRNTFTQEGSVSGSFENEQFAFYETLTAYLPLNFRTDLSYRIHDNESTIPNGASAPARKFTDNAEDYQLDIVHRLYQSLDTTYRYLRNDRSATSGDTTSTSHLLSLNYTKLIPRGRALAGINFGRTQTDNQGVGDIVDEEHRGISVPGSFTLNQPDVIRGSISVLLIDPNSPQAILLTEGTDYTLAASGNRTEIVISVPPSQIPPQTTYDFITSYSFTIGELTTDSRGYNVSVELLDHLLTPYYSYVNVSTRDHGGSFPGSPLDSTTQTAGLALYKGWLRARGEYQRLDWEVSPYRAWRAELQAIGSLRRAGRLYATATYLNKRFPQGTTAQVGQGYTEATTSFSGTIQKQLAPRNMMLSAGGTYSRLQGLVDTVAQSVNASMNWKIGRIDLSVGASAYRSETEGLTAGTTTRSDEYYYLKVRRELF